MAKHFDTQATVPVPERLLVKGGAIEVPGTSACLRVGIERQLIGRASQCALPLDDSTVSALHAEVQATPMGVRLLDLGSRNGTFLGDTRMVEAYLQGTVEFRCGQRRLRFVQEAPRDVLIAAKAQLGTLLGTGPEMLSLFATLERFAPSSESVNEAETGDA